METYDMFERMEITEQVYKGGTPSKTTTRSDADRVSNSRKLKGGKYVSCTNPKEVCAGNSQKNWPIRLIGRPMKKHTCCMAPETSHRSVKY